MSRPLPPNQALSTTVVSHLLGGVSSRADALRHPSQVTEMINALPNISEGLKRRPRTNFLFDTAEFDTPLADPPDNAFLHTYNRDVNERYVVLIVDGDLKVISLADGTEKAVTFTNGAAGNVEDYLDSTNPKGDFRAITIGDKTFIVNSSITVAADDAESPEEVLEGMVWVRIADFGTNYSIVLDGSTYTVRTSQTHREYIDTANIALNLYARIPQGQNNSYIVASGHFKPGDQITLTDTISGLTSTTTIGAFSDPDAFDIYNVTNNGVVRQMVGFFFDPLRPFYNAPGRPWYPLLIGDDTLVITGFAPFDFNFTATTNSAAGHLAVTNEGTTATTYTATWSGSTIRISRIDNADLSLAPGDGLGAQALECIKGSIQLFEDLPGVAPDGFQVKVTGDPLSAKDDYYVVSNGGVWTETLKGGELTSLDPQTMPHVLTRNSDGTFEFAEMPLSSRVVGSLISNPMPSIVGQKIKDIFFYKGRLGVVAGINVVMTGVNDPYNYFRTTVTDLLDSDLIDIEVALERTAGISWATPTDQDILLWTDLGQVNILGNKLLTPKTIEALPASNYVTSLRVKPVHLGDKMYYAQDKRTTTALFEYRTVLQYGLPVSRSSVEISEDVASYLKGLPTILTASDSGKTLVVGTDKDSSLLYICTLVGQADQSFYSWHKWQLSNPATDSFIAADIIENELVVLVKRGSLYMVESLFIEPSAEDTDLGFQIHLDMYTTQDSGDGVYTPA